MRVTHVITRLIVGGAQENTIATVLGLQGRPGLTADLISGSETGPEGSLAGEFADCPGLLTLVSDLVRPISPLRDRAALRRLTQIFREKRPDIVHTHSGKAGILGRLAAHRAGVPVIIHTIHGPSFGAFQGAIANVALRSAERRAGKVTTHFVAVADAMREQYLAAKIGSPQQYTVIRSGFDLGPFLSARNDLTLRAKLEIAPRDIVIGKIARLFKLKGHEDLFAIAPELVRQFPRVRFLLVGDGPWRRRFERQARSLGLEQHFIFTGLVRPEEVAPLVGIMDVVVHLSRREGLARALPQAMAAGKPVVAYDCDGAGEVCLDGRTGFLVRAGELKALRESLARLIEDAPLRERLGRTGRDLARQQFDVKKMVDDLFSLYLRLAPGSKMPPP